MFHPLVLLGVQKPKVLAVNEGCLYQDFLLKATKQLGGNRHAEEWVSRPASGFSGGILRLNRIPILYIYIYIYIYIHIYT
jgi:hypothetical protein